MCSFRSWPTQKARPVPVSTTHRTESSPAASSTMSRSATLVAMSRAFIASGRSKVMVATPSATSYRTELSLMCRDPCFQWVGSMDGQAVVDEAPGRGAEPVRVVVEERGGAGSGPVVRQQLGRKARVAEEELAPLVHQLRPDGEGLLVVRISSGAVGE